MRTTDGTSAQLTNQSSPEATWRGSDQPLVVRSANLSEAVSPDCSIQLRIARPSNVESRGSALPRAAAGEAISTIFGSHARLHEADNRVMPQTTGQRRCTAVILRDFREV